MTITKRIEAQSLHEGMRQFTTGNEIVIVTPLVTYMVRSDGSIRGVVANGGERSIPGERRLQHGRHSI